MQAEFLLGNFLVSGLCKDNFLLIFRVRTHIADKLLSVVAKPASNLLQS